MSATVQTSIPTALIARISAGDRNAEGELVETFSTGLTLMLRRIVRDPALAEDLHQETFRIVLEKARAREIRDPERLSDFLRGTARNLLLHAGRSGARLRPLSDGEALAMPDKPANAAADSENAPQLRRLLRREESRLVRRLLGEMRFERDRQILIQFYLSEKTKQEVCDDLGVDGASFKRVLFNARVRLRELWERSEKAQRIQESLSKTAAACVFLFMKWSGR